MGILSKAVSAVKSVASKVVTAVKAADVKLGGGTDTLSRQLTAGAKTAVVATGITTAAKAPIVATTAAKAVKTAATAVATKTTSYAAANPIKTTAAAIFTSGYVTQRGVSGTTSDINKAATLGFSSIENVGENVAEFVSDPSLSTAKNIFTENPLLVGGAAALAGGALVKTIAPAVSGLIATSSIENALDTATAKVEQVQTPALLLPKDAEKLATLRTDETGSAVQPLTPATQVLGKPVSTSVYRRRAALKKKDQQIRVSNRISILNYPKFIRSEKYIN